MSERAGAGEPKPETVRVVVEFEPGTEISGRVRGADATATEFQGRLELYSAIEHARARRPSSSRESPGRRQAP